MSNAATVFPNLSSIGIAPPAYRLPISARLGKARLAVSTLETSIDFYTRVIGLQIIHRDERIAWLGVQNSQVVLLELQQLPGITPIVRRSRLGLYHTAFLLPTREALSSFVQHLNHLRIPFGAGDHLYSEALYLVDPDGLSVEVYADRPRSTWTIENREIVGATDPVRFETFPAVPADSWQGAPSGTKLGHVHFYVGDLDVAKGFYHEGLGMDIVTWRYQGALFVSVGGYHHDVGLNNWAAGSPVAATTDARLLFWELELPSLADVKLAAASLARMNYLSTSPEPNVLAITDPWGVTLHLVTSH